MQQAMLNVALQAARDAAEMISRSFEKLERITIMPKEKNDFVTEVDQASEKMIIKALRSVYPDHSYLGEEYGLQDGKNEGQDYLWIIDPLDGTTNFIHGIPHFAISIACQYQGKVIHGVIINPMTHEEFCASRGYGATLNNTRIRVSNRSKLEGALIGTGIPFTAPAIHQLDNYLNMLRAFLHKTNVAGIRRAGAAALDLAYVACGRLDGFWEMGLHSHDVAAGALIIQESGGLVSDFSGNSNFIEKREIVCAPRQFLREMLKCIHPFTQDNVSPKL